MIINFQNKSKKNFGKFETKKEEGLDRAFFIFNKNITQEQWSELINKYKNHWSKRGYKCDIDNDMLKIMILSMIFM